MKLLGVQIPFTQRAKGSSQEQRASPSVVDDRWFSPSPYVYLGGGNEQVTPESAIRFSAVYGCVKVISETLASVPLVVYRRRGDGGKDKAKEHPLYRLLRTKPNNMKTSGLEFREMLTAHVLLWGNGYAQILRNSMGEPTELYPMHPSRVTPDVSEEGRLIYRVRAQQGPERILQADEVFHIRGYRDQGLSGLSPIAAFRQAVTLGLSLESFGSNFFDGGAFPAGVLEYDGALSDEAKKNLRESWQNLYGGQHRGKKVAVLEAGLKWKPMGIPQSDAEFLATRRFQVEEIARIYRVPPHMLGDLTRSTFSNIEQQSIDFVTYTMLPWFKRWEEAISRDFLNGDDSEIYTEFLVDGLLRGDTLSRFQAYGLGRQWGLYSINDIRLKENLNPIGPEGDVYLSPLNMVPAGQESAPAAQSSPTAPAPEPDDDNEDEEEDEQDDSQRTRVAFTGPFREQWKRILHKQNEAIARQVQKLEEPQYLEWAQSFMEEQRSFARKCLKELAGAYFAVQGRSHDEAEKHLERVLESYWTQGCNFAIRAVNPEDTEARGTKDADALCDYWTKEILG
jgi:HK97 family phage portal protein